MLSLRTAPFRPVVVLLLAACSSVEPSGTTTPPGMSAALFSGSSSPSGAASSVTAADRNFISQAAFAGWSEVALGQLAEERAASSTVAEFARRMVTDHTRANQELATLASQRGLMAPRQADPGRQAMMAALESATGANFDRQYVQQQLADHEVSIALFRNQSTTSTDPELRAFAQKYLPVLQEHHDMLRSMAPQVMRMP